MSYPSINEILESMGVTNETATDDQRYEAFVQAFQQDLPNGWALVKQLVAKLGEAKTAELTLDDLGVSDDSVESKQFRRLMGPDVPKSVLIRYYNGLVFHLIDFNHGLVAVDEESADAILAEYEVDGVEKLKLLCPEGFAHVEELVASKTDFDDLKNMILDPNAPDAIEMARLMLCTPYKRALEKHFGKAFGFYNCHRALVADDPTKLNISARIQIDAQDPKFIDC